MLSNFGNLLLLLNICLSLTIIYKGYNSLRVTENFFPKTIYQLSILQSTFIVICFFTLIAAFIISDFSLITVYQNSHTSKPIFYKIVGAWGNHEGSLLLWVIILIIFSFLFLVFNKDHPKEFRVITLIIQNILISGFLFFILFNSNPFSALSPVPKEGLGLNPILQDPALAIHPPLLYLGFVGASIYFSAAMASLITNYSKKSFVHSIPWFAMTALFHSLIVFEKRGLFYYWVIILCLLTFILSVMGTFLVRSGILNSVHTFANDPTRGMYILLFLAVMIFSSIFLLFQKYKKENYELNPNSKETFILANNWFMMFYLLTVLLGTIYPIFTDVLTGNKISVGPPFYNMVILPIVALFILIMTIGPNMNWIKSKFENIKIYLSILIGSLLINFLIIYLFKSYSFLSNLIIISAIFLIISTLVDIFKSYKKKKINFSQIISHASFGFLVLFIGLNHNYSIEKDYNIKLGETKNFDNYSIKLQNLELSSFSNYKAIIGELEINNNKTNEKNVLKPEIRIYDSPQTLTYEASIKTNLLKDYYLTMSNIDRSEYYNIKFQKKPLMIWIWISVICIVFGGILRLLKDAKKN